MHKPNYQLIVFDWEGTLSDTFGQIFELVCEEASIRGLLKPDRSKLLESIQFGPGIALKKLYPDLSEDDAYHFLNALQKGLTKPAEQVFLLPGAFEFIQLLYRHEYNVAIASNKGEQSLAKAIKMAGLSPYVPIFRSAGQAAPKPHPEMLEQILNFFHCPSSKCLMVGDSETDIEMAKQLHITAVGMDFYHQKRSTLEQAGAEVVIDNFEDLAKYIGIEE